MGTVQVYDAERMQDIEDTSVVDGHIDGAGHLILVQHDGTEIDAGSALATIPTASETVQGIVELATAAETTTGSDTTRAVTPAGVSAAITAIPAVPDATTTVEGIVELATNAEVITGTDTTRAVTASSLADAITTAKLATNAVTTIKITDSNVTTAKIADSNVTTAKIADANVTNAKLADMAASTIKGRITSTGVPTDLSVSQVNTMLSLQRMGCHLYRSGQTLPDATLTVVTWNSELEDTDGLFSSGTTITIPSGGDGLWSISCMARCLSNIAGSAARGFTTINITRGGAAMQPIRDSWTSGEAFGCAAITLPLAAGDSFTCDIFADMATSSSTLECRLFCYRVAV